MKIWQKSLIAAFALTHLGIGVAAAGDSVWQLRLGASYRDFDAPEFAAADFRNAGAENGAGPYGVQNISFAPGNPIFAPVILDTVSYRGAADDFSTWDKMAPVIGFSLELTPLSSNVSLSLVSNFMYHRLDSGSSDSSSVDNPGDFTIQQFDHFVLDPDGTLTPGAPLIGATFPGGTYAARNKFLMDVYVMDVGLEVAAKMDKLRVHLAAGPTVTITNTETSQRQQATWIDQGPGLPAGSYTQETKDQNTDFLLGAFAAVGVSYQFDVDWSIGLEGRYDYVMDDAGTDQATLDMSGFSGILSVGYRF